MCFSRLCQKFSVETGDSPGGKWGNNAHNLGNHLFSSRSCKLLLYRVVFPIILLSFLKRGISFSGGGDCAAVQALGISLK